MGVDKFDENSYGLNYGMIWIDVEDNPSSGCSWEGYSTDANCNFLIETINAIRANGRVPGVYSS
jgi:hypothetical protein